MADHWKYAWDAWVNELLFKPRFVSQEHLQAMFYPKKHPKYLSVDQALRPWALDREHPLHRPWMLGCLPASVQPNPGWFVRWLFNRPMKKSLGHPLVDVVTDRKVYFWMDESGVVWLCPNKWGRGKELAGQAYQKNL